MEAIREIERLRGRGKRILFLSAVRGEEILVRQWFEAVSEDRRLPVYSVTKTVTALLVGSALREGRIGSLEETVAAWFPDYRHHWQDPAVGGITLKQLLTMTAGLRWPEIESFGKPEGVFRQLKASEDPVGYVLRQPLEVLPGSAYAYSSGVSHLLMHIVARAAGEDPARYADRVLWTPCGIRASEAEWLRDPRGIPYGGHGLQLTARGLEALARFWAGGAETAVSQDFHQAMTALQVRDVRGYDGYGYQTWIGSVAGHRFYGAFGHGGQRIYVFPETALRVVFLGAGVQPEFGLQERVLKALLGSDSDSVSGRDCDEHRDQVKGL